MSTSHQYAIAERLLTVDKISVTYDKPILRDLSFNIDNITRPGMEQGQVVSLLGPSGMGKTQLFRCIAGLQKPTIGTVRLNGDSNVVKSGDVGVVMQHYPLLQHRTVIGNLKLVSKDNAEILSLLERFGLVDKKDSYPCQLSGGQRQRIAIIQQLLCDHQMILMDEPFSGLDVIAKMDVIKLINEISTMSELNTVVVITHDIPSALMISDHVMLLGRDRDEKDAIIPGARIQQTYDLIERDLCWHRDVEHMPNYQPTLKEMTSFFHRL